VLATEVVDVVLVDTLVLVEAALVLVEAALVLVASVVGVEVVAPWLAPQTKGVGPGISYVVKVW
jgi:hypothetical protein